MHSAKRKADKNDIGFPGAWHDPIGGGSIGMGARNHGGASVSLAVILARPRRLRHHV